MEVVSILPFDLDLVALLARNIFGHYLAGFIQGSSDILLAELYAIYKALLLAKDMSIDELVCYSDSLHCVNL
ncbi:RNA-directed DNA polymerase (Reverse transcriptase), partial [Trifolium medium]|nr:RNA-directed DNA polymerase (Reverse transcriptase) [Trifolium medium]